MKAAENHQEDVESACRLPGTSLSKEVRPAASCADKRLVGRTSL